MQKLKLLNLKFRIKFKKYKIYTYIKYMFVAIKYK